MFCCWNKNRISTECLKIRSLVSTIKNWLNRQIPNLSTWCINFIHATWVTWPTSASLFHYRYSFVLRTIQSDDLISCLFMGMLEQVFAFWWPNTGCPSRRQPARIMEKTLESGNLFSETWIPPLYLFDITRPIHQQCSLFLNILPISALHPPDILSPSWTMSSSSSPFIFKTSVSSTLS